MSSGSASGVPPTQPGRSGRTAGRLLCVGGPPGAGKTTVGRQVAGLAGAALVDLDSVTTPLVDAIARRLGIPPALDRPPLSDLRDARYACVAEVVRDTLATGTDVVAVAPFTREATDATSWRAWAGGLGASTATLCWLDLDADSARRRATARGLARDVAASDDPRQAPAVTVDRAHIDVVLDAGQPPHTLANRVLAAWTDQP